jgi:hypothetical protein
MSKKCGRCGKCLLFVADTTPPKYVYCDGLITIIPKKINRCCIIL